MLYTLRPGTLSTVIESVSESFSSSPSLIQGRELSPSEDVLGGLPRSRSKLQTNKPQAHSAKARFRRLSLRGGTRPPGGSVPSLRKEGKRRAQKHIHSASGKTTTTTTMKVAIVRAIRLVAVLSAVAVATPHVRAGGRFTARGEEKMTRRGSINAPLNMHLTSRDVFLQPPRAPIAFTTITKATASGGFSKR
jgi:hypothetical protein